MAALSERGGRELTTSPSTPRIIAGRYVLDDDFREGGMSRVYRAIDRETHDTVAVKILSRQVQPDERWLNLEFQRETQALSRLRHPHIVELLDVGRDNSDPYFVFPWLPRDLETTLAASAPAGWDDFADPYALPLLEALAHAHAQQVLHRDIKPSNVLVAADGTPKLADFGIAKLKTEFRPGLTFADFQTRPYAPPEFDAGDFSYTRDVYGWGVLCLMALTGIDPFDDRYGPDRYQAIADALDALDVPSAVDVFLRRCVSDDPEERPRDAAVAFAELASLQDARRQEHVQPQVFYLSLSGRIIDEVQAHFGLAKDEALRALEDELADDVAVAPFVPRDGAAREDHFYLLGGELRLHVAIHETFKDRLHVFNVTPLPSSLLEKLRDRAFRDAMRFIVGSPPDRAAARDDLLQLQVAVAEAEAERAQRERDEEQRRVFRAWRETLQAKSDLEREREAPIRYTGRKIRGQRITFTLAQQASEELIGQQRQLELSGGGFLGGEIYDVSSDEVQLAVTYGDLDRIPTAGLLKVDTRAARSALNRQFAALDAVTYGRSLRPDLGDLITKPETVRPPRSVAVETFVQQELDDAKKEAVSAALGAEDMLIVEGPPGTGKTTFITELVIQYLRRNPGARVLVTSQTHAALDNVLERLADLDQGLRLVRVARANDPRVSPAVTDLLIDAQVAAWSKEIVTRGRAYLRQWAKANAISERDVELATHYEELAALVEGIRGAETERASLEADIAAIRPEPGQTAEHLAAELEERLAEVRAEIDEAEGERDETVTRLVKMRAIEHAREVAELAPAELRERASSAVDRTHPAFSRCQALIRLLSDWHARFGKGGAFHAAALLRADVVAATCLGLHSFRGADAVEFDLCIVDEASKATATESLVPMAQAKRWILVGDPRQLPPFIEEALLHRQVLRQHELEEAEVRETLFERLLARLPSEAQRLLSVQHRMVPAIGNLISECFYGGALESAPKTRPRWLEIALPDPVTWYTTASNPARFENAVGTSRMNQLEARLIRKLLRRIDGCARMQDEHPTVAVLTGYAAQRGAIEREIASERNEWRNLEAIEVSSIDAFQGREADVVIYSVTRSNPTANIGFLYEPRRLNVALSRGRRGLILVGDHVCARRANEPNPFHCIIDYIERNKGDCALEELEF